MIPFTRLRAWALLLGAFVIVLGVSLALPRKGSDTMGIVVGYPLVLLWSLWLARRAGVNLRQLLGPRVPADQVVAILALVPAMVAVNYGVTWVVYTPISWLSPEYVRDWLNELERLFPDRPDPLQNAAFLFAVIVLAPVVEEVLFRGLLLHRWSLRWGARAGVILTTIAFAMLHASPVSAFLSGVGLAMVYLRTGSLPLTMGAHALNNFIAAVVLPRLGEDPAPGTDALLDFQQGTLQGIFAFCTGIVILWLGRKWYLPDLTLPLPYERNSAWRAPPEGETALAVRPGPAHLPAMRTDFEYIVLGLGGLGSAAAYWLSRSAGAEVLGLEQFELGHVRGESQDHSRIIRLSYHTPGYVRLAKRAYESWAALEKEAGEPCILRTGGLDVAPRESRIPLDPYMASMRAEGVEFEHLEAREIMRRWPQFTLTDDCHGLYQPEGGIAMAARANAMHQRMAREHGATLRDRTPVSSVRSVGGEVEVVAGGKALRCRRLAIAAGPWSGTALGWLGVGLPLEVTQEQVTYYATPYLREFEPGRFPVWIWMDDPCFYGFPVFGEPATKIAQDAGGKVVTAETRSFEPDPENSARVESWARRYLPRALGPVHLARTCLYTLTPDRDFVIDTVPGHAGVAVAIGAGHAFKFASVIGRILGELAVDGRTPTDLAPFSIDRPVLKHPDPPRSYMV